MIGLYGGSFDPIHNGHLNVAIGMMEAHNLDEIWFCPAMLNPLKQQKLSTTPENRLEMLKLAIEGFPGFQAIDIELKRPGPSYTIDTLDSLKGKLALIIGEDSAKDFHLWRSPEKILARSEIIVASRGKRAPFTGSPEIVTALNKGLTEIRLMEISSTEVRERLRNGKYCGHLVPTKVLDYITKHQLYSL